MNDSHDRHALRAELAGQVAIRRRPTLNGRIDAFRIHRDVLSAAQIASLTNN